MKLVKPGGIWEGVKWKCMGTGERGTWLGLIDDRGGGGGGNWPVPWIQSRPDPGIQSRPDDFDLG